MKDINALASLLFGVGGEGGSNANVRTPRAA
jgi:hypothetical protein